MRDLESILSDNRSGSSKIIKNTLELLKDTDEDERLEICKKILDTHPSMAGLRFIVDNIESGMKINKIIDKFEEMNRRTSENLEKIADNKIVTVISRSHIVERGLLKAKKINVLESRPEKEGIDTFRWLKDRGKKAEIYLDAFMSYAVKNSDIVVSGADSLLEEGFINKTGTLPLALTARHFNKDFYVAAPSYKFIDLCPEFDSNFEFVERTLVTEFIQEK